MSTTRGAWTLAFLRACGFPASTENQVAVLAWMESEYSVVNMGFKGDEAQWNPLDTTETWSGATWFNHDGVRNYLTESDGIGATVATIRGKDYGPIRSAMLTEQTANTICARVYDSPWGSKPTSTLVNTVRARMALYQAPLVYGPSPEPAPPPSPVPVPPTPKPTPAQSVVTEITGVMPVRQINTTIPLDSEGRGAVIFDGGTNSEPGIESVTPAVQASTVLAVTAQGSDPATDSGTYAEHSVAWQVRNGFALVTVWGGAPNGTAPFWVTATS